MQDKSHEDEPKQPARTPDKGVRKSFALRIKPETMDLLERWAQDEFRSVNGQIEFIINQALQKAGRK